MVAARAPIARPLRAALYCRVSTAGQEQDGTSLDSQEAQSRAHIAALGWTVAEEHVYREVHSGGELHTRPALTRLREAARGGEIDAVVSYAVDRISRNQAHLYILA